MATKKELKERYKRMRPEMGIFHIESKISGNRYLYTSNDLKSLINRFQFQLNMGSHPNRKLQDEWREQGADSFSIKVLERLEYDKDESKQDYSEDLELLKLIWEERPM